MIVVKICGSVSCSWSMLTSCFSSIVVALTCIDVGLPLCSDRCVLVLLPDLPLYTWCIRELFGCIWTYLLLCYYLWTWFVCETVGYLGG